MGEAIEKFDINAAAEQLKGQIRSAFIELLTPEQFQEMVRVELKRFTEDTRVEGAYGHGPRTEPSQFAKLCRSIFEEHVKAELKSLLESAEYQGSWGNDGRQQVSAAVKTWLTENRQALIESTVMTFAASAAQRALDAMRHGG